MTATMNSASVKMAEPFHSDMAISPSKMRMTLRKLDAWRESAPAIGYEQRRPASADDVHGLRARDTRCRGLGVPLRTSIVDAGAAVVLPFEDSYGLAEVERRRRRQDPAQPPAMRGNRAGNGQYAADDELHGRRRPE